MKLDPVMRIVIPVRAGDGNGLKMLLQGLSEEADALRSLIQALIVVNDGPDPHTEEIAYRYTPFPLKLVDHKGPSGSGRPRNAGVAHGNNEWLMFLDCHTMPAHGFGKVLSEKSSSLEASRLYLMNGIPKKDHAIINKVITYFHLATLDGAHLYRQFGWFSTGLMIAHTSLFRAIQFSDDLSGLVDYDFISRARKNHIDISFIPELRLYYPPRTLSQYSALRIRKIQNLNRLKRHHPETPLPFDPGWGYFIGLQKTLLYRLYIGFRKQKRSLRLQDLPLTTYIMGVLLEWLFEMRAWLLVYSGLARKK